MTDHEDHTVSICAEQAVLGALLADNDALDRVSDLDVSHFYRLDHRLIFEEISRQIVASKRAEPDARNSVDMQWFNAAVHAIADMPEHADGLACFTLQYCEHADHIKRQADKLGISRPTYYNRSRAFARKAYSLAQSLKSVHHRRLAEPDGVVQD